jgi:hypothetical protein
MRLINLASNLEESVLSEAAAKEKTISDLKKVVYKNQLKVHDFIKNYAKNIYIVQEYKGGQRFRINLVQEKHTVGRTPQEPSDDDIRKMNLSFLEGYDKKTVPIGIANIDYWDERSMAWNKAARPILVDSIPYRPEYPLFNTDINSSKSRSAEFQRSLDAKFGKDFFVGFAHVKITYSDPEFNFTVHFGPKFLKPFFKSLTKILDQEAKEKAVKDAEQAAKDAVNPELIRKNKELLLQKKIDEINGWISNIPLKKKRGYVEIVNGVPYWSYDHFDRMRLDHYVGDGWDDRRDDDQDDQGWDEEAWYEDYAGPIQKKVSDWIDQNIGKGLFDVEVGEKGHVDISLTDAGLKKYGLK